MPRSLTERSLAALMLLWFTVVTTEPAALHSCPLHSGTHATATGSHGDHDASGVAHEHPAQKQHRSEHHQCVCIGTCNAGSSITWLPSAPAVLPAAPARSIRAPLLRDVSAIVTAPEFLTPYANGPPLGHRVA